VEAFGTQEISLGKKVIHPGAQGGALVPGSGHEPLLECIECHFAAKISGEVVPDLGVNLCHEITIPRPFTNA